MNKGPPDCFGDFDKADPNDCPSCPYFDDCIEKEASKYD